MNLSSWLCIPPDLSRTATRSRKLWRNEACDRNRVSHRNRYRMWSMSWCLKKTKISEPIIATQYICKVPFLKSSIWRGTGIISFIHTLMDNRFKNLIVHKILCSWSPSPPTPLFQLFISNVSVCVVSFRISPQTFVRFSTLFKEKYMASMSRQNWG